MNRKFAALISLISLAMSWSALADEEKTPDWSCSCLTFDGSSENCHMFANVEGPVFSFGAFETSGDGPYTVERTADETVLTSEITTVNGAKMTVIIAEPSKGGTALIFTDERKPGGESFTAKCEGKLPK
ncbi:hypothetical protein ACSBOB_12240 [Mesorhizobium sp. ASY16-5R]|jgi:hypothetical protein|uniref:hypothetical protein n=1 Tax=Mesorhizobium sp. ASY16-5R TaxID=3445772 RepID=UPI003F9F91B4